jgi:hypothetical protein
MATLIADINAVLERHGIPDTIQLSDITVTDRTVTDHVKEFSRLSKAIENHVWPPVPSASVFHYTSRSAAEAILSTSMLRLSNIEKRAADGEIDAFCKTHNLTGYLATDENGLPKYRTLLMPDIYCASFTETNLTRNDEDYFWRTFAAVDGVRLRFDVKSLNPDFRKIAYETLPGTPIPVFADLTSTIRLNHGREFISSGISRLCAFYLASSYARENEYRALFKAYPDWGPQPVGNGPSSFIEVPLNQATPYGFEFRVTEVHARSRPNMPDQFTFSQREQ